MMREIETVVASLEAGVTDHREARAHKLKEAATLIRRLEKERDEARNKALDEAAHCLQTSTFRLNIVAVVRACVALILALKSKEPKP